MGRGLAKLIAGYFGYDLSINPRESDVTVGTAVINLVPPRPHRAKLRMCNFGGANVVVGPSNKVTATTGIQLSPGQTIELDWQEDYDEVGLGWWGIAAVAGNQVHIIESWLI